MKENYLLFWFENSQLTQKKWNISSWNHIKLIYDVCKKHNVKSQAILKVLTLINIELLNMST